MCDSPQHAPTSPQYVPESPLQLSPGSPICSPPYSPTTPPIEQTKKRRTSPTEENGSSSPDAEEKEESSSYALVIHERGSDLGYAYVRCDTIPGDVLDFLRDKQTFHFDDGCHYPHPISYIDQDGDSVDVKCENSKWVYELFRLLQNPTDKLFQRNFGLDFSKVKIKRPNPKSCETPSGVHVKYTFVLSGE